MRSSIQWKIVAIYLCVVLIIMVVSGTFIIYNIEDTHYNKIQQDLEYSADRVEGLLELEGQTTIEQSVDQVKNVLATVVALNTHRIYILDETGRVVIGTSSALSPGDLVDSETVMKAIESKKELTSPWVHFSTPPETGEKPTIEHAKPILDTTSGTIKAIIYVVSDATEIYDNVFNVMKTISLGSVLAMAIAALFSAVFSRMITEPIVQLTKSAKQLAAGSFNRIPIYARDEIGELTQSFNFMATELSRTMADISSEKSKLEKILENMADGVMAFNRQGVLIHANSICYEMLGTINMDHRFDFIFPKLGIDVSFDKLLAGEEEDDEIGDGNMMTVDERYFKLHFAPYNNVLGESEGLVVVMQDVTTMHKLDQMRKEFVANVSHELRTPLTTVKIYTETLLDGALEDKEIATEFLQVMEKEADRMTNLVQDLLELSRIDNKQMQLEFKPFDLKGLVKDAIAAQRLHAEMQGHKLICEMDERVDYDMLGDQARIKQILHNILSNAIKYSIDPGTITVRLYKNKNIVLQVQDTGIGISKADLNRIFERFYRVDKARSRSMGGTGLGLSIAKELVELHEGSIKMASKPGKGTTVTIQFKAI